MPIIDLLKKLGLEGEVSTSAEILHKYSQDASLFEIMPEVVVFPKNVQDLKKIVDFVRQAKKSEPNISITPRSAGTDMSGGALGTSIILEFTKYFNKVMEIGGDYATTQPGVYYKDFEKLTLEKDLLLPPYPASKDICTVGGMAANNSAGEKTLTWGKVEDYVKELNVVLQDGNEYALKALNPEELNAKLGLKNFEGDLYRKIKTLIDFNYEAIMAAKPRVSKNSAGYYLWNVWDKNKKTFDLTKLFVGSQGTLGIITKIKYRLVHPLKNKRMLVIFLRDLKELSEIINTVLAHKPESFESYDDKTLKLALKFLPEMAQTLKGNIFKLAWQFLPELAMIVSGGLPKLVLMAEFAGESRKKVDRDAMEAKSALQKFKIKTRLIGTSESEKYWTVRRQSFNLLRHHIRGMRTAPFIDDIIVRPENLPEFLPALNGILSQYNLIYTIAGHVGDGNFHIIPLMDFKDPKTRQIIPKLAEQVYSLVLSYKGSITAEHNDGLIRTPYLRQMFGDKIYALFEEVKKIFDTDNIFNPRKKVGADIEYAMSKIVKTS